MPGFPIDINPSISTLVDNAQRTNPALGKKSIEQKKTKLKSGESSKASASNSDSTSLSDDMLGDMDPDQYKGKDNTAAFRKKMQEWLEEMEDEEKKKEEEDKDGEEGGQGQQDGEEQTQDTLKEEPPENAGMAAPETPASNVVHSAAPPVRDILELEEDKREKREEAASEKQNEQEKTTETQSEKVRHDQAVQDVIDVIRQKREKKEVSAETVSFEDSKKEEISSSSGSSSDFMSLLSYDDGFIIADTSKKKKTIIIDNSAEEEMAAQAESAKQTKKSAPPPLNARFAQAFEKLIVTESRGKIYDKLCHQLKVFGIRVLEQCHAGGERILLIPRDKSPENFGGLFKGGYSTSALRIRYGYFPAEKLMVIGEEVVEEGNPLIRIPVLYFAHVFDHSLGDEGFASEKSPAVLASYKSCLNREQGHLFIDSYSSASPVHYFAQTVEAFLTAPHGQLTGGYDDRHSFLCTKEELYDIDRTMYAYIEYLFRQVNRGEELNPEDESEGDFGVI
ncbi:MAG: hypothetical protein LWY06_10575 [Firmicutes bacterium]|nr:hypothetical protein [Bacillota bacterium]